MMKKINILGVGIDNVNMEESLQRIESLLKDRGQHYLVTPNPEFLVAAQTDEHFRAVLNRADLAVPDGIGLIFASWFLGRSLKQRVRGVDLMQAICRRAAAEKWRVFLLGAGEGISKKAAGKLLSRWPGLKIEAIDNKGLKKISLVSEALEKKAGSSQPAVLFVALGMPKQEKWIAENLPKLPALNLAVGVGGALDFIAGRIRRAPRFLRNAGLEWFWRLLLEPRRAKRIFRAVVKFPWLIIRRRD